MGAVSMGRYVAYSLALLLLYSFGCARGVYAQSEPFYKGKTISIVVGYNPGDAHDLWARAYARYMGRYIPGNPNLLVRNMPGGGTMIAANYVYGVADPDGTTLGSIFPTLYFAQLTGRKEVRFDWAKFNWIGSPEHNGSVFYTRADRYKTLDDLRKVAEPAKCSTTAVGTSSHYIPKLIEETLGIKLTLVTGYPGGAEQDLALERGEVQCRAVTSATFFGREPLLFLAQKRFHPPVAANFAKTGCQDARRADVVRINGQRKNSGAQPASRNCDARRQRIRSLSDSCRAGSPSGTRQASARSLRPDAQDARVFGRSKEK